MTPAEILCWRYSYVELMWELILSRNAKMKRETDLGLCEMPSRRTKSIKISGNAKMRRETDQNLRKVTFCDGKRGKFFEKSFPAAGKGKNVSENGFLRREGV